MEKNNKNTNKSPPNPSSATSSPDLSPLSSLGHRSPPPSDLFHVSPSPASPVHTKDSKTKPISAATSSSDLSSLSSLGHVSPSPALDQTTNNINYNNHINNHNNNINNDKRHVAGPGGRGVRKSLSILKAVKRKEVVRRAALGFRVWGSVFCLVSLAVMAADKEKGWAVDSFYRYKEFRYCISVNVVGFLYSVAQTCDLAFTMCTGKYVLRHHYRFYVDFAMDQILTYLLMSASSSAATRVDDWESNWGKDDFPMMASISVGLSFMSFVALAASTLISGYALCTWSSS